MRRTLSNPLALTLCFSATFPGCGDASNDETPTGGAASTAPSRDAPPPLTDGAVSTLVAAQNSFALNLFREVAKAGEGDLFFSPLSVHQALAMAYAGAAGETRSAMREVLGVRGDDAAWHGAQNAVAQAVVAPPVVLADDATPPFVRLVNTLFVQDGFDLLPAYMDRLAGSYSARPQVVDFENDTEGARATINAWVADATEDRIPELLKMGMLGPSTRLTLVNAVYFLGQWATAFEPDATFPQPFQAAAGPVEVPFMHGTFEVRGARTEAYDAVELPYAGGELSLLAIAPTGDLAAFEAGLDDAALAGIMGGLTLEPTAVAVPRFEMRSSMVLKTVLTAMGMGPAFSEADFSGITGDRSLAISEVVHEAWVRVDEAGTEAAAATAVVFDAGAAPLPEDEPRAIRLDRPFLGLIRHAPSGAILFMARITSPQGG